MRGEGTSILSPCSCETATSVGYWGISHKIELLYMWHATQGQAIHDHRGEKEDLSTAAPTLEKGLKLSMGVPMSLSTPRKSS